MLITTIEDAQFTDNEIHITIRRTPNATALIDESLAKHIPLQISLSKTDDARLEVIHRFLETPPDHPEQSLITAVGLLADTVGVSSPAPVCPSCGARTLPDEDLCEGCHLENLR